MKNAADIKNIQYSLSQLASHLTCTAHLLAENINSYDNTVDAAFVEGLTELDKGNEDGYNLERDNAEVVLRTSAEFALTALFNIIHSHPELIALWHQLNKGNQI